MKTVQKKLEDLKVGDVLVDSDNLQYRITEDLRFDEDDIPFRVSPYLCGDNLPCFKDYNEVGVTSPMLFNVLDTTDQEQEKKIIEIDGVKYEVTKDGDGWSKPALVEYKKGDEVEIKDLKVGDSVSVNIFVNQCMIDRGQIQFDMYEENESMRYIFGKAIFNQSGEKCK